MESATRYNTQGKMIVWVVEVISPWVALLGSRRLLVRGLGRATITLEQEESSYI